MKELIEKLEKFVDGCGCDCEDCMDVNNAISKEDIKKIINFYYERNVVPQGNFTEETKNPFVSTVKNEKHDYKNCQVDSCVVCKWFENELNKFPKRIVAVDPASDSINSDQTASVEYDYVNSTWEFEDYVLPYRWKEYWDLNWSRPMRDNWLFSERKRDDNIEASAETAKFLEDYVFPHMNDFGSDVETEFEKDMEKEEKVEPNYFEEPVFKSDEFQYVFPYRHGFGSTIEVLSNGKKVFHLELGALPQDKVKDYLKSVALSISEMGINYILPQRNGFGSTIEVLPNGEQVFNCEIGNLSPIEATKYIKELCVEGGTMSKKKKPEFFGKKEKELFHQWADELMKDAKVNAKRDQECEKEALQKNCIHAFDASDSCSKCGINWSRFFANDIDKNIVKELVEMASKPILDKEITNNTERTLLHWQEKEWRRCSEDVIYFAENYIKIWPEDEKHPKLISITDEEKMELLTWMNDHQDASTLWMSLFTISENAYEVYEADFYSIKEYYSRLPLWMRKRVKMSLYNDCSSLDWSKYDEACCGCIVLDFSNGARIYTFPAF